MTPQVSSQASGKTSGPKFFAAPTAYIPQKNPQEFLFDKAKSEMSDFIDKINNFEKITNNSLKDLWRIKDIGF
jgi:hypothetical protein